MRSLPVAARIERAFSLVGVIDQVAIMNDSFENAFRTPAGRHSYAARRHTRSEAAA